MSLGTHVFRLHPRQDLAFALEEFSMAIQPQPAGMRAVRDAAGNLAHEAWFEGETRELRVAYRWAGRTLPRMPMEMLSGTAAGRLPPAYHGETPALLPFLRKDRGANDPRVSGFAEEAAAEAGGGTLAFLRILDRRIRAAVRQAPRPLGPPLEPDETLARGQGSCRDLAVLFVACCRSQGLASRFVSGYLPAAPGERQHMHAWAEARVPGAGWQPFDPSQAAPVGLRHVAVAAAADPGDAAPISGYYSGSGAHSVMDVDLTVDSEDP